MKMTLIFFNFKKRKKGKEKKRKERNKVLWTVAF